MCSLNEKKTSGENLAPHILYIPILFNQMI